MLNEEKEALEILKLYFGEEPTLNITKYVNIVLNLIEKQQKEIEELNKSDLSKEQSSMNYYNLYKELVDKIKAKIEVMNTNILNAEKFDCDYIGQCRFAKYVLQSLLEKE